MSLGVLLLFAWRVFAADPGLSLAPVAVCGTAIDGPTIDGVLNDDAWRGATMLGPFVRVATHDQPGRRTVCRITRHDGRLCVAFECYEPNMDALSVEVEGRDSPRAWTDDCVHLFIAPGDPRRVYYHLIVTAANVLFDERVVEAGQDREPLWDADAVTATHRSTDRWTCEISLPLADVADRNPVEGAWAFNAARAEQPHSEWSSWSLLNASLHEFANFGRLLWLDEPVVKGLDLPTPFVGRNEFRVSIGKATGSYLAELQIIRQQAVYPKMRVRVASRTSAAYGYSIQDEGAGRVRLVVRREHDDEPLYVSPPVAFDIPLVVTLAEDLMARLTSAGALAATSGERAMRNAITIDIARLKAEIRAILQTAARLERARSIPTNRWTQLHQRTQAVARQTRIAELKSRLLEIGVDVMPSFALGAESSLRKLSPLDCGYSISRELHLACAKRERESAQVVVASLGRQVDGVRVEWTGLRGPDGARIAHGNIDVSRVGYVTTRRPVYRVERVGRWPDPLLPLDPFSIPANEICPLWVTVSVPPDAPPGEYLGELRVSAPDEPAQVVKLAVDVWDIELPIHGRFKTGFGSVFKGDIRQWYDFSGAPPEDFRKKFYGLLLKNRVNPAGLYVRDLWPLAEDLDWCYERGLNALSLGNLGVASAQRLTELARAADRLRDQDRLDIAYVYGFSNLQDQDIPRAQEGFRKVRHLIPGLRRACPVAPMKPLWGYVNTWAVLPSEYDSVTAQRRAHLGEEVWWYVCCGPRHPYPNFFIDYPATDARMIFWAAHKYGVAGLFYYEVAMWASNLLTEDIGDPSLVTHEDQAALSALRDGRRWPDVPWNTFTFSRYNGDGQLIYPGRNETPLPSLRLELIRDGIEDYELLALLRSSAKRLQELDDEGEYGFLVDEAMRLAAVRPEVVRDLASFTRDPRVIAAERERVARQVMRLQRVIATLPRSVE